MSADQAIPLLEKVLGPYDDNIQEIAINALKSLITENLITRDQLKQLQPKLNTCAESFDLDTLQIMVDKNLIDFDTAYSFALRNKVDRGDQNYKNFSKHMNSIFNIGQIAQKAIDSSNNADLPNTIKQLSNILYLDFDLTSKDISKILQVVEKCLNSTNKIILYRAIILFQSLIDKNKKKINPDEIQAITQRLLEFKEIDPLTQMCYLNLINANKSDQLIAIIKEKLHSSDSEKAIDLLEAMIPKRLVTADQIKELIAITPDHTAELEKLLKKAQTLKPKQAGKGMLSQGAFKSTPVSLMRHNPSDLTKLGFERAGITPEQVRQQELDFKERLAEHPDFRIHAIQPIDLEQQRDQILERQQQMPYETYHSTDVSAGIGAAGKMSMEQQQRRLMRQQDRLRLPTIKKLGRAAVKAAQEAIRP